MRGVGAGSGGLPSGIRQGPPLPVTRRLIHPPPKMTQGGNDPPNPPSSPSTASLSEVARCWHSNAYFSLFSSLLFFDPPNRFVQIPRDLEDIRQDHARGQSGRERHGMPRVVRDGHRPDRKLVGGGGRRHRIRL